MFFFNKPNKRNADKHLTPSHGDLESIPLSHSLMTNQKIIEEAVGKSPDVILRSFTLSQGKKEVPALLFAIGGLVNETIINENVLEPLMREPLDDNREGMEQIQQRLYVKNFSQETNLTKGIEGVLKGAFLLLFEGIDKGILVFAKGFEMRSIEEPPSEAVVRGSHEGFIESVGTNMAMIRRRIQHPSLRFDSLTLGEFSRTQIIVAYIEGIVQPELVDECKRRLKQIKVDNIISSGEVEQYIEDNAYTLFPTIGNTERPSKAAVLLMEGRIILLVDGDPVSLYAPLLFIESFQSPEDYNSRPYYSSLIRLLRILSFFISIILPSLFIAALNFHKEMIPSELIMSIAEAREKVPFPLVMEVILMTGMFEVVREAGVRMPRPIGQAVSIVGALILGQVSVQAGLVGAPTIIVISISAIAAFVITPIADVTGILRSLLIIPTSIFGLYGLIISLLAILTHMVSLTSLGIPYLAPFAPVHFSDWKDTFFRLPLQWNRTRPKSIPNVRSKRIHHLPIDDKEKT